MFKMTENLPMELLELIKTSRLTVAEAMKLLKAYGVYVHTEPDFWMWILENAP